MRSDSRLRRAVQWGDVRNRHLGMWAYVLNRLSGIGLVVYLFLHLGVLSMLAIGPAAWDSFVALAKSPLVLVMDVVLLAGLLIHGLNGIRITLNGMGIGVRSQKPLFIGLMAVALVATAFAAVGIFSN